jgi:hypothetical protein
VLHQLRSLRQLQRWQCRQRTAMCALVPAAAAATCGQVSWLSSCITSIHIYASPYLGITGVQQNDTQKLLAGTKACMAARIKNSCRYDHNIIYVRAVFTKREVLGSN